MNAPEEGPGMGDIPESVDGDALSRSRQNQQKTTSTECL